MPSFYNLYIVSFLLPYRHQYVRGSNGSDIKIKNRVFIGNIQFEAPLCLKYFVTILPPHLLQTYFDTQASTAHSTILILSSKFILN